MLPILVPRSFCAGDRAVVHSTDIVSSPVHDARGDPITTGDVAPPFAPPDERVPVGAAGRGRQASVSRHQPRPPRPPAPIRGRDRRARLHRRHPDRPRPLAGLPPSARSPTSMVSTPTVTGLLLAPAGRSPTACRRPTPSTRCASSRSHVRVTPPVWRVPRAPRAHLHRRGPPAAGRLLRAVPAAVAASPAWASVVDPVARVAPAGGADPRQRRRRPARVVRRARPAPDRLDARQLGRRRPRRPRPGRPTGAVRLQLDPADRH